MTLASKQQSLWLMWFIHLQVGRTGGGDHIDPSPQRVDGIAMAKFSLESLRWQRARQAPYQEIPSLGLKSSFAQSLQILVAEDTEIALLFMKWDNCLATNTVMFFFAADMRCQVDVRGLTNM